MFGLRALPNLNKWLQVRSFSCEESRIVRTMIAKDQKGLFVRGGFVTGAYSSKECYKTKNDYRELQKKGWGYIENYLQDKTPYLSAPGLNTLILYPFWRITQTLAKNSENKFYFGLQAIQAVAAAKNAIVITLLCLWIARETSIASAIAVALAMMLTSTNMIYIIGHHTMFNQDMLLVPFLAIAFAMQSRWRIKLQKNNKKWRANLAVAIIAAIATIAIFAKILFGWGYDMLAPTMITATIPIFWYAVKEKWQIKKFCLWFTTSSIAIVMGLLLAFAFHYWQAKNIGEDFIAHAQNRASQRIGLDENKTNCQNITNKVILLHYINKAAERISGKAINNEKMLVGEKWQTLKKCASRTETLLLTLPSQILLAIIIVPIIIWARRKKDWQKYSQKAYSQKENTQAKQIEKAIVVAIGIAILAAVSQPLTLKQATATHSWWGPLAWELMFRPMLFLLLAFTLRPLAKKYYEKFTTR